MKSLHGFLPLSRRRTAALFLAAGAIGSCPAEPLLLWYEQPAKIWEEALPIGNGSLGCMIFGNPANERVQFNEQTLWLGDETEMGSYQPFGDVHFDVRLGTVEIMRRELSLDNAVHTLTFESGGVKHRRESFSSHPAGVIATRFQADTPGQIDVTIRLTDAHKNPTRAVDESGLGPVLLSSGKLENGLRKESRVVALPVGGKIEVKNNNLVISGADSLVVLLAAGTDFANDPAKSWRGADPGPVLQERMRAAAKAGFDSLKADHIKDHRALFDRLRVSIGPSREDLPTDKRLAAYQKQPQADTGLETLLFQYGRYLLIGSSRPGGLPANLQGIWNKDHKPAWYSGYTTNINVEMNYWLAEPANLSECHLPLLQWIENLATVRKKNTQPAIAAKRGWTIYSTNNPMGGNSTWGIHRPGAAWLAQHLWTHYTYTGDKEFLARRAYPLLKELVEYWEDELVEKDGKLIAPRGWSPEHGPVKRGDKWVMKEGDRTPQPGASYDQQIVWDLFTNYIEAAAELGVDAGYRAKTEAMRAKLLGPQIGRWGQLQEWMQDVDDPNNKHRHVSHLFAVHPGRQISPVATPEWAKAATTSLNARGDSGTGWSIAWKINFWARLADGNRAHKVLRNLITPVAQRGRLYPNLFDAHPPFQIDGNFGATSGMIEMLLQSHVRESGGSYVIDLLPSLPDAWPDGTITGLRARGGFDVSLTWKGGKLATARITSRLGNPARLLYQGKSLPLTLEKGQSIDWKPE